MVAQNIYLFFRSKMQSSAHNTRYLHLLPVISIKVELSWLETLGNLISLCHAINKSDTKFMGSFSFAQHQRERIKKSSILFSKSSKFIKRVLSDILAPTRWKIHGNLIPLLKKSLNIGANAVVKGSGYIEWK